MNAQEAIEITRWLEVFHEKNPEAIEALSIVLESAKMLHEDILGISNTTEWTRGDETFAIMYDLVEQQIEIQSEDFEKLGIEVNVNE